MSEYVTAFTAPTPELETEFKAKALFIPGVSGLYHIDATGSIFVVHNTDKALLYLQDLATANGLQIWETTNHENRTASHAYALAASKADK